jgi:hypothetical protein
MKKPTLFALLIFFFISTNTDAQVIKGIILDNVSEEPIIDAYVFFKNTNTGTHTNKKGRFNLKLPQNNRRADTLTISHINYLTKEIINPVFTGRDSVFLQSKANILSEVQIKQNKKLKRKLGYKKMRSIPIGIYNFASFIKDGEIYILSGDISYLVDAYQKAIQDYPYLNFYELQMRVMENQTMMSYSDKIMIYDIKTDSWKTENDKLIKRASHTVNHIGGKAYITGGKRLSDNRYFEMLVNKIEVYDLNTKKIEIDKTNPHQSVNSASFSYNDNIIIMGGSVKKNKLDKKTFSDKVHVFDTKTGLWYDLASMPSPKETSGVLINDKIYLFGGYNNEQLDDLESYDLKTGKWKIEGKLFDKIGIPAIASNGDDTVYFYSNGKLNLYNVKTRILKQYLIDLFIESSKIQYFENKLYLLGGYNATRYEISPSSAVYSIDLDELDNSRVHKIIKL